MTASAAGSEMVVLERLFTPEEAGVYLAMSRRSSRSHPLQRRSACPKRCRPHPRAHEGQGPGVPEDVKGRKYYAAAPFMHGFFEHQLYRRDPDPELPRLIEDYLTGGFIPKTRSLRTIPIQADLPARNRSAL
jgi:hypothetical protein